MPVRNFCTNPFPKIFATIFVQPLSFGYQHLLQEMCKISCKILPKDLWARSCQEKEKKMYTQKTLTETLHRDLATNLAKSSRKKCQIVSYRDLAKGGLYLLVKIILEALLDRMSTAPQWERFDMPKVSKRVECQKKDGQTVSKWTPSYESIWHAQHTKEVVRAMSKWAPGRKSDLTRRKWREG